MRKAVYLFVGIGAMALLLIAAPVFAQGNYPGRPLRILVGFPPGGGQDVVGRIVAKKLTEALGQQVIVENRPGASGRIAGEVASKAAPDGYTLWQYTANDAANVALFPKLPYDPFRDFAPVTMVSQVPYMVVVHPSLPVKTIPELVALAKAKPGQLNYGSTGTGGSTHLSTELFKSMAGINMMHVPYKGAATMQTDLFSGQLQVVINTLISLMPHAKSGKVRGIAVTSSTRSTLMPEMPTVAESGLPGYEASSWNGIMVPANTPKPIVTLLNREIVKLLKAPDTVGLFSAQGSEPRGGSPEEFDRFVKAEIAKWTKVVKALGIRLEE